MALRLDERIVVGGACSWQETPRQLVFCIVRRGEERHVCASERGTGQQGRPLDVWDRTYNGRLYAMAVRVKSALLAARGEARTNVIAQFGPSLESQKWDLVN
jgi:hypothetical protein